MECGAGIIVRVSLFAGGATRVGELFFVFFACFDGFTNFFFDFGARTRIFLTGAGNDSVEVVARWFWDGKSGSGEGGNFFAIDNHADNEVAIAHLEKVRGVKGRLKLFNEDRSVIGGNAERNSCANVAEDGVADRFGHLGGVLVGNCEVKAVFACLGKDNGEGVGGEVLELVDIKIEWATIFNVGDVGARHGGELDLGNQEGAEDAGIIFADEALAEIDNEDFAFVHDFSDVKAGLWLTDDISDNWVSREGADFVQDRSDRFGNLFVAPGAELLFPELENGDVFAIVEGFFAEFFVGEHAGDVEEGGLWTVKKGEESVAENVLETWAPAFAEHTFQDANDFGADIWFSGGVGELKWVKSNGVGCVSRVEIDNVFNA